MPTVSPSYSLKGVSNPYYVMDPSVTTVAKNALKKVGIEVNSKDILFKFKISFENISYWR